MPETARKYPQFFTVDKRARKGLGKSNSWGVRLVSTLYLYAFAITQSEVRHPEYAFVLGFFLPYSEARGLYITLTHPH